MKKFLGVVMILLIAGSSAAAEYWHLGIGFRGTGVVPGGDGHSLYITILGLFANQHFDRPDDR